MANRYNWQDNPEWMQRRDRFDQVPALYDAYRPGYPQELVQFIVSASRIPPGGEILEIGSGTGKATRLFAQRGYSMLCIEPGANLVAFAQELLGANQRVSFEVSTFEDWSADDRRFDLILSAQAFHWIPTSIAYEKSARILKPSGSLALVWNMHPDTSGPLWEAMQRIYADVWPSGHDETIPHQEMAALRAKEISESGYFDPPQVGVFPWSETYTTESYLGLLSTNSNHISLEPELRHKLFSAIGELIDSYGGQIERPYLAYAYVAQVIQNWRAPTPALMKRI